jgi:hypothetical protein
MNQMHDGNREKESSLVNVMAEGSRDDISYTWSCAFMEPCSSVAPGCQHMIQAARGRDVSAGNQSLNLRDDHQAPAKC